MVKITFLDGTTLIIKEDTILNGYKESTQGGSEYYMTNVFSDSIDGQNSKNGSRIATSNPKVGILGFLCSVDTFSIGLNTESNIDYFPSAVKSVENL